MTWAIFSNDTCPLTWEAIIFNVPCPLTQAIYFPISAYNVYPVTELYAIFRRNLSLALHPNWIFTLTIVKNQFVHTLLLPGIFCSLSCVWSPLWNRTYRLDSPPIMQGLFVPFTCIGSGDPVRVLHLFHNKYTGYNWSIYCWDYVQLVATKSNVLLYLLPISMQLLCCLSGKCTLYCTVWWSK